MFKYTINPKQKNSFRRYAVEKRVENHDGIFNIEQLENILKIPKLISRAEFTVAGAPM
jgi:hypothetical protein